MYIPEAVELDTRVMLLGSGELGREVTIALRRLGAYVHAVDRYAGAPAHALAQDCSVIDMTDAAALRALVEEVKPDFIVPEIEALATDELAAIEAAGIATVVPTARATQLTMNREGIRNLAHQELGLPTSEHAFASSYEELLAAADTIGFPCVIKPVMSSSGKGQSTAHSVEDLAEAWQYAMDGARVAQTRVIVEQFIPFDYEITLLTVRSIDPTTGEPATWFCEPIGHRQESGDYVESWQPAPMSDAALDAARSIAARITCALGGRGVFGVELFVKGDDVYFSEVSPRPHDTGMVTLGTQRASEFELHARAILGLPIDTTLISPGASSVIYGIDTPETDGKVAFAGLADALSVPEADVYLFGKPLSYRRRRLGVAVATAENPEEARRRATAASSAVRVIPSPSHLPDAN